MKQIKIIFKTHLDVGFTGMAADVIERYCSYDIPQAIKTAEYCRNIDFRYTWTVGAWLLYLYLERSDASERRIVEKAIERGDITWHALPFTVHSELAGETLFRYGLSLSQKLDERFGRHTIAAKLTDVPGHTRGIIRPLSEAGVSLLHIGINPASAIAQVPPLFRWRDSCGNEIIVIYQSEYGSLLVIPGQETAYQVVVGGDNTGAQTPDMVRNIIKGLKDTYPDAEVRGANLNDLAEELTPIRKHLPLITGEIGDSWIHGVGSDPQKVAQFRELCRFYIEEELNDQEQFNRNLLQITEHTWGFDEKTHFFNRIAWSAEEMKSILNTHEAQRFTASWQEQRNYLSSAIESLPTGLAEKAKQRLQALDASPVLASPHGVNQFKTAHFQLEIDPKRGCITELRPLHSECRFASTEHPLFLFVLESFDAFDMEHFMKSYLRSNEGWALADFGKPGMSDKYPRQMLEGFPCQCGGEYRDGSWYITITNILPLRGPGGFDQISLELELPDHTPEIHARLQWFGKSPDRQPHAVWLGFHSAIHVDFCRFAKLGEMIEARDAIPAGGHALHAIDESVSWGNSNHFLTLSTLDAPLLAPGRRQIGDFSNELPKLSEGISINLYNNFWGTNFPMWFGDDMAFRFQLQFNEDTTMGRSETFDKEQYI